MATVLAGTLAGGCVMNRASGKSEFSLVSQAQELEMGKQGDQEILQQYGAYDNAAVTAYVQKIGRTVADHSDHPELAWQFRVLDSPVVNAFALPGGYIYVTRGLLAYLQNEAQLAVILGHEIGHVTARHTADRLTRQNLATLGMGLSALLIKEIRPYMGLMQGGMQLLFLSFGRGDESEADELGVRYATRAGYAAGQGAAFFTTLKRLDTQKSGGMLPEWASTHPDPAEREKRVLALAAEANRTRAKPATLGTDSAAFLPRIATVVYGEDPRQGYVRNGRFIHPGLAFQFPVPDGWEVHNLPAKVELIGPDPRLNARIMFGGTPGASPEQAARAFVAESGAAVMAAAAATVHGQPAYRVESRLPIQTAQGAVVLRLGSTFIQKGPSVVAFHGFAPAETYGLVADTMAGVAAGFAPVTDRALLNVAPKRLGIVKAGKTGPFQAVLPVLANSPLKLDDLAILNQRDLGSPVVTGTPLKVVR
jgi:predicted Zn-dependent protease